MPPYSAAQAAAWQRRRNSLLPVLTTSGGSSISSDMGFPFALSVVGLTIQLGGPQLAVMGDDPPAAVVEQHDEDRDRRRRGTARCGNACCGRSSGAVAQGCGAETCSDCLGHCKVGLIFAYSKFVMFPCESSTRITSLGLSEMTVRVVTLPLSSSLVSDEAT